MSVPGPVWGKSSLTWRLWKASLSSPQAISVLSSADPSRSLPAGRWRLVYLVGSDNVTLSTETRRSDIFEVQSQNYKGHGKTSKLWPISLAAWP